jgi:hypothetical protein
MGRRVIEFLPEVVGACDHAAIGHKDGAHGHFSLRKSKAGLFKCQPHKMDILFNTVFSHSESEGLTNTR